MRALLKILTISCAVLIGAPAYTETLPSSTGRVVLQVGGAIENTNREALAEFDADMLRNLDWREIETYTTYTEGAQVFAGPTLRSLLDAVGADGSVVQAMAINDYFVEIPASDADDFDVILAMEQNGQAMRIRDKGPIWVIYPLSADEAELKEHDDKMIWQLNRITVTN